MLGIVKDDSDNSTKKHHPSIINKKTRVMRTLAKLSKKVSGIVEEQNLVNRHVIRFCNSNTTLWKGTNRFAH
ncbi:MAG: hypothetical protein KBT69_15670 [Oceanihabitans sp.]|nr:hypothetical protein [Oceanihabitans sp.]